MMQTPEVILHSRIKNFKIQHLFFIFIAMVPVLLALFLTFTAHYQGTDEFEFSIKPSGLVVTRSLDYIKKGDHTRELWGIPSDKVLSYLLIKKDYTKQPHLVIIERDKQQINTRMIPRKLEWAYILKKAWAHYFLIIALVTCSLSAVLLAPSEQPTLPFFAAFISSAVINANDLTYQFGFADPGFISMTYLTILVANWLMFSSWAHFSLNFPMGHQLLINRSWAVAAVYAIPPIMTLAIAYSAAGSLSEFWFWIHRIRRLFVPMVVIGSYIKIVYDFRTTKSPIVRNQLKYPLVATWFGLGPYLFLFVLPIIILNHPLIEYRWVVLLSPVFPIAFFMAMIQFRMMDIDETITKSITYIILVGGFYVLYATSLYLIGNVFWTRHSSWLIFVFILAVGFLFSPVKEWIISAIDHLFFRDKLQFTELLQELSKKVALAIRLSDLADVVTKDMPEYFRLKRTCFLVLDNKNEIIFPETSRSDFPSWPPRTIIKAMNNRKKPLICQERQSDSILQQELTFLDTAGYHLIIGLKSGRRMHGLICTGLKSGNRMFSRKEVNALLTLSNQITVALENIKRYEDLKKSSEEVKSMYEKLVRNKNLANIGEMTSLLAHEIRTPLSVISSSAQHLATKPDDVNLHKELLEYIIGEAENMDALVTNLLGLAKYKLPVFSSVDLTAEMNTILDRWEQGKDHNSKIKLIKAYHDIPVKLTCDLRQLGQVILNLIRNSEDAMPDGGSIHLNIVDQKNLEDESVNVMIQDNGPGINPDDESEVFKKFFSTKEKGLGLGLVLCKQIVQAHSGTITIENLPSQGVLARISLPKHPYPDQIR